MEICQNYKIRKKIEVFKTANYNFFLPALIDQKWTSLNFHLNYFSHGIGRLCRIISLKEKNYKYFMFKINLVWMAKFYWICVATRGCYLEQFEAVQNR